MAATGAAVAVPLTLLPGFIAPDTSAAIEFGLTLLFGTDAVVRVHRVRTRGGGAWAWTGVALDVVAAVPWSAVGPARLLVLRLVKLVRVAGGMRAVGRHFPGLAPRLRLATFAYWLVLTVHLVACGFLALGGVPDALPAARYTDAAYWGVTTLTEPVEQRVVECGPDARLVPVAEPSPAGHPGATAHGRSHLLLQGYRSRWTDLPNR